MGVGQKSPGLGRRHRIFEQHSTTNEAIEFNRAQQDTDGNAGFEGLAVRGIVQHRKTEFRMFVPTRRSVAGEGHHTRRWPLIAIRLAIEIARPDRMDGPSVYMPGFTVMMIGFRMHVKQRDQQHPDAHPDAQGQAAKSGIVE